MVEAFFISIITIVIAFCARFEKNRNYSLPIVFIIITIFLSLGYNWGPDVPTYESYFNIYNGSGAEAFDFSNYYLIDQKSEYGYVFINQLCNSIGFWWMRTLLFCFENAVIYLFIKKIVSKEWYWFAMFIYTMNLNFMILSSSMMRQWLAMCIVILGLLFLERRRWLVYCLFILLATSIHRSSIICLPLVAIPFVRINASKYMVIWLFPVIAFYYVLSSYIVDNVTEWLKTEDIYSHYTGAYYSKGVGIVATTQLLVYLFMFVNMAKIEREARIYIVALLGYGLVLPFYNYTGLANRLGFFFTVLSIGAYPLFLKKALLSISIKYFFLLFVIILTIYSYVSFIIDPMWYSYYGRYITLFDAGIL